MDIILILVFALVFFGAGYGFRGLINREIKTVAADLKAEFAKVETAVKSKL
jgi:hypothetical protein